LKALFSLTVTGVPSALVRWASYAAPDESVSTRITVAPGTAARAACLTLAAVEPVSSVSPGPWVMVAGFGACACAAKPPDELDPFEVDPPLAALAIPAAPTVAPAINAAVTSQVRTRDVDMMSSFVSSAPGIEAHSHSRRATSPTAGIHL